MLHPSALCRVSREAQVPIVPLSSPTPVPVPMQSLATDKRRSAPACRPHQLHGLVTFHLRGARTSHVRWYVDTRRAGLSGKRWEFIRATAARTASTSGPSSAGAGACGAATRWRRVSASPILRHGARRSRPAAVLQPRPAAGRPDLRPPRALDAGSVREQHELVTVHDAHLSRSASVICGSARTRARPERARRGRRQRRPHLPSGYSAPVMTALACRSWKARSSGSVS